MATNAIGGPYVPQTPITSESFNSPEEYQTYLSQKGQPTNLGGTGGTTNEFVFPTGEQVKPYSGLPESYRDQLLGFMMPQLQSGVQNMEGNIDDYTQNALGTYRNEFNQYINEAIPKQLRNLSKRGILNSSVAENSLSQTYSDALRKSSGMGYNTAMEAAKMKANIPQSIGSLLQYGQYSEDPTVMYKTLAGLLAAQMP